MDFQMMDILIRGVVTVLIGLGIIIAIAWIIRAGIDASKHKRNIRAQLEFHNKLLERFGSASEFTGYLQTEAGQRFFESLSTEPERPTNKILGSVQKGTVLTVLGFGLLFLGVWYRLVDGGAFTIFGVLTLAFGAGFLISAGISYRLLKAWGLITAADDERRNQPFAEHTAQN